ncbi:ribosome binding protein, putative [Babesia ovata]|uniref:Ribosome binding protein, putative n=1 Tax=Babesia ovata TaxID=189622 RepID=A0A2H6KFY2_9APIC|nr:ribosome binding protein, putative [Babesia ovata]GBE61901.1 ribosome binding protein, putative [Babesia ovata]
MTKHNIQLDTLKQCLMFLQWLHSGGGKKMQTQVALDLYGRIKQYFKEDQNNFSLVNVEKGLSAFLTTVSAFYTRLCKDPAPGKNVNKQPKEIVDALLECLPKFLAAIYFLEYCVNPAFKTLGGGWWEQNWPAWNDSSGGDLAKYLYATTTDRKYSQIPGLIPGGFGKDDQVIYYTLGSGYYQGAQMSGDLQKIVDKQFYNFFRSVFVSSVIGESAKRPENAANSLVLARTFCDIVLGETDKETGGKLIEALNAGLRQQVGSRDKSICWKELHSHCTKLRKKFYRLFGEKHFDFTGLSTDTGNLNKTELAKETANWIRQNVVNVRGHLNDIDTSDRVKHLGEYFTKNLFPYGFTIFNGTRFKMNPSDLQTLKKDWREVIEEFKKSNGDLNTLREILSGTYNVSCKNQDPPPEKKAEGAQNQGKKAEAAKPTATKVNEGAQNQGGGKVRELQIKVEIRPPSGGHGATSPQGPSGDRGQQRPTDPVPTVSSSTPVRTDQQVVQVQHSAPGPQGPLPPPPPPPLPGPPALSGQPGVPGSTSDDATTIRTGPPQDPARPQTTGVSGAGAGPTGDKGAGTQGGGGAGQQGNRDVTQPTSQSTDHDSSGDANTSDAPASGGGGGRSGSGDKVVPQSVPNVSKKQCKSDEYLVKDSGGNEMCFRNPQNPAPTKSYGPNLSPDFLKKLREKEADVLKKAEEEEERRRQQYLQYYYPKTFHQIPTAVESSATMGLDGVDVSNESLYDPGLWWEQRYRNDWNYPKQLVEWTAKKEQEKFERNLEEAKQNVSKQLKDTWILQELRDDDLGHVVVPYIHTSMPLPDPEYPDPLAPKALSLSGSVIDSPPPETDDPVPPPTGDQYDWDIEVVQPHPDAVESALIGIDPYSDVKDDGLVFEKIDRQSDAKQDYVDLHIDVAKPIVQDLVDNPDEYLYSNAEDILRDELKNAESWHGEDKGFSALPKSNFNIEFTPSFLESDGDHDAGITRGTPRKPYDQHIPVFPDSGVCQNPWYVPDASSTTVTPPLSPPPDTDHLPPPDTVREMLCWLVGMAELGYIPFIEDHLKSILTEYNKDVSQPPDALEVTRDPYTLDAARVANTLTEASLYGASVLHRIKHKDNSKAVSVPDFSSEYSKLCYSTDPARLLCQLRDYVYACCHQLEFLRSQCSRKQSYGGWQDCEYGRDIKIPSPLQAFLTDASTSKFETHRFDPCDICLKSRINMGFQKDDFSKDSNDGKHLHTILSPAAAARIPC